MSNVVDGDATYSAAAAPKLLGRFRRDQLDMPVATRLEEHDVDSFRPFQWIGNLRISGALSMLFRTHFADVVSGYRVLSRRRVDLVPPRSRRAWPP